MAAPARRWHRASALRREHRSPRPVTLNGGDAGRPAGPLLGDRRATGLAAYAAICISIITGISLRTATLRFLSTNRFHTSYGQLAIGLGTISFDIYAAVTVTSWLREGPISRRR
ncbi:MAG: hypothetical protein E6H84_00960 [Chloroflexi bacterium]|nr:MAG: hypothetical protein E6H84_00960 [Chloroflexota bacterium]